MSNPVITLSKSDISKLNFYPIENSPKRVAYCKFNNKPVFDFSTYLPLTEDMYNDIMFFTTSSINAADDVKAKRVIPACSFNGFKSLKVSLTKEQVANLKNLQAPCLQVKIIPGEIFKYQQKDSNQWIIGQTFTILF